MENIYELTAAMEQKRGELRALWDSAPRKKMADGSEAENFTPAQIQEIQERNQELNELGVKLDALRQASSHVKHREPIGNRPDFGDMGSQKSISDQVLDASVRLAKAYAQGQKNTEVEVSFANAAEMKTTMTTSAGFAPFVSRSGEIVDTVQVRPILADYLQILPTAQNAYKFMEETTFTNNANPKAEGAAYDEAALAYTERTVPINRLGTHLPVTEEQLEDEVGVQALIERRLAFMVRAKMGNQVINGDGTAPNWRGLLATSGVQTQAKGTDPIFDAIMKAITKVNSDAATTNGGGSANLVVMNIADYEKTVLARTPDGLYIMGEPTNLPVQRLWGLTVISDQNLAAGTAMVMDTTQFAILMRKNLTLAIATQHSDDFTKNITRFRADIRGNVVAWRPAALCTVTGV